MSEEAELVTQRTARGDVEILVPHYGLTITVLGHGLRLC
jgi:hypothetical protein